MITRISSRTACFALAIILVGCAGGLSGCCPKPVVRVETVTVDKPIPVIPPPPEVPPFVSAVDTLSNQPTPGEVSKAYVTDMVQLRALYRIQFDILSQYRKSSANFDDIQVKINELFKPPEK